MKKIKVLMLLSLMIFSSNIMCDRQTNLNVILGECEEMHLNHFKRELPKKNRASAKWRNFVQASFCAAYLNKPNLDLAESDFNGNTSLYNAYNNLYDYIHTYLYSTYRLEPRMKKANQYISDCINDEDDLQFYQSDFDKWRGKHKKAIVGKMFQVYTDNLVVKFKSMFDDLIPKNNKEPMMDAIDLVGGIKEYSALISVTKFACIHSQPNLKRTYDKMMGPLEDADDFDHHEHDTLVIPVRSEDDEDSIAPSAKRARANDGSIIRR